MASNSAEAAVLKTYETWRKAWLNVDGAAMKELFDAESPAFIYQSEETPEPLRSFVELDRYWDLGVELLAEVGEWTELSRQLDFEGDVAVLYVLLRTELVINGMPEPLGGVLRVSLLMHERDGVWKIFHYHESRQLDLEALGMEGPVHAKP